MLHIMRAAISNQFVAPQRGTETASATKPDRGMARHLMDVVAHCCFQDIIRLRSLKCACVCACACVFVSSAWGNLWRDIDILFLALRTNPLTKVCAAPAGSSAVWDGGCTRTTLHETLLGLPDEIPKINHTKSAQFLFLRPMCSCFASDVGL